MEIVCDHVHGTAKAAHALALECDVSPVAWSAVIDSHIHAMEQAENYAARQVLEAARDAWCGRCSDPNVSVIMEGEYRGRHVFMGDVLDPCPAMPINKILASLEGSERLDISKHQHTSDCWAQYNTCKEHRIHDYGGGKLSL